MSLRVLCLGVLLIAQIQIAAAQTPTYVRLNTTLGNIDIELYSNTPLTDANFLSYVNSGAYNGTLISRSVPNFIIQSGFVTAAPSGSNINLSYVSANPATVTNEPYNSNIQGTIAMAKVSGDVNSATDQWFFNLVDNSANLDNQNGGFTAFGIVTDASSLAVVEAIGAVPVPFPPPLDPYYGESNLTSQEEVYANFDSAPLVNYNSTVGLLFSNLVLVNTMSVVTLQDFSTWQTAKFTPTQQATAGFTDPGATPWNDGVPNLLKYLFDIDPSRRLVAADRTALPVFGTMMTGTTTYMTLSYHQSQSATGLNVVVETSGDMQTWNASGLTPVQTGTTTTGDLTMTITAPVSSTAKFMRLNVTGG